MIKRKCKQCALKHKTVYLARGEAVRNVYTDSSGNMHFEPTGVDLIHGCFGPRRRSEICLVPCLKCPECGYSEAV